jgi:hypothetical protein
MPSHDPQLDFAVPDSRPPTERRPAHDIDVFNALDADPLETHTDWPLPQCGNGGNCVGDAESAQPTAAELMEALDGSLVLPAAPPLHDVDWRAVVDWAETAAEGLLYRRDRRHLVREVLRVLEQEWRTAEAAERLRQQIEWRDADRRARGDGTYWTRRDSGRRARQPTHIEVDPGAWAEAKAAAKRRDMSVGEYVGRLVIGAVATAASPAPPSDNPRHPSDRTRLFARLAVEKPTWNEFVARSLELHVTVARQIGIVVERAARPNGT